MKRAEQMRVCVVGTRGFPGVQGGVETHCERLYPRLARLGCEVTVFRRTPYVAPVRGRRWRGVELRDIWCPGLPYLEPAVHTLMGVLAAARRRADILHVHCGGPALWVPLARLLGLKVVFTTHGPDYERAKWGPLARLMLRLGELAGVRCAHRTIAIADHIRRLILSRYGVEAELIPNGVELPRGPVADDGLQRWGVERGKYVLALGRFEPGKGFRDLLDAFAGLGADFKLVIAGGADHPTRYSRSLQESASKTEGVVLTGVVKGEALRQLYAHSGLFVLPSHQEGLPLALLEALSHGCSVLVSDIPANRSVPLPPDRFFPPRDVPALRAGIDRWLGRGISDAERVENLQMLRERFDWDRAALRTLGVYREVLGEGPAV